MIEYGLSIGLKGPGLFDPVDWVAGAAVAKLISKPVIAVSSSILGSVNGEGLHASSSIAGRELRNAFMVGTSELQKEASNALIRRTIPSSVGELTMSPHAAARVIKRQITIDEILRTAQTKPLLQTEGDYAGDLLFHSGKIKIAANSPFHPERPFYIRTIAVSGVSN